MTAHRVCLCHSQTSSISQCVMWWDAWCLCRFWFKCKKSTYFLEYWHVFYFSRLVEGTIALEWQWKANLSLRFGVYCGKIWWPFYEYFETAIEPYSPLLWICTGIYSGLWFLILIVVPIMEVWCSPPPCRWIVNLFNPHWWTIGDDPKVNVFHNINIF